MANPHFAQPALIKAYAREISCRPQADARFQPWPAFPVPVRRPGQFERNLIRERTVAGLTAVRARRRNGGRPPKLSAKEVRTIRALLKTADNQVAEIVARFGIARSHPLPNYPQACRMTSRGFGHYPRTPA